MKMVRKMEELGINFKLADRDLNINPGPWTDLN
jgi:hypothetical protein